jgi:hypothetical protein
MARERKRPEKERELEERRMGWETKRIIAGFVGEWMDQQKQLTGVSSATKT